MVATKTSTMTINDIDSGNRYNSYCRCRSPSISSYFFIIVAFIHLLESPNGALGNSARRRKQRIAEKQYRKLKEGCQSVDICGPPAGENMNCIFECISSACFEEIYAPEPLEDGEIDLKRERLFVKCTKRLEYEKFKRKRMKDLPQ